MVKLFRTQLNPKIEQVDKFVIFSKLVLIKNLEPICFFFFFTVKQIQSRNWLVSYEIRDIPGHKADIQRNKMFVK